MSYNAAHQTLPQGHALHEDIDLVKNRKQMLLVSVLSIVLALLTLGIGWLIQPKGVPGPFDFGDEISTAILKFVFLMIAMPAYIVGHEAAHGVCMWYFSHVKPKFGFSFSYAYAGSEAYFRKAAYLIISMAPAVFWAIVLAVMTLLFPADWFWMVWLMMVIHISGCAGDLFVFVKILRKPAEVLVQDSGTAMKVYLPA